VALLFHLLQTGGVENFLGVSIENAAIIHSMNPQRQPDPLARALGHAVVGGAAFYLLRRFGAAAVVASVLTIVAHEALDAPVSQKLTDLGI
jgi:hypothetical protein